MINSIDHETVYEVILYYVTHVKAYMGAQDLGRECTALPILFFCTQLIINMKAIRLILKYLVKYYLPICGGILLIILIMAGIIKLVNILPPGLNVIAFVMVIGLIITIIVGIANSSNNESKD